MNLGCPTCPDLDSLGDVVYDTGMLIALAEKKPGQSVVRHREFGRKGLPVVPAPVVAQAWRGGASQARLARALKECAVVCCYTEREWRRVGELIGRAELPAKKRPDPVDGLVALTALQIGAALVATSDPDDIAAYLAQMPGGHSVIPVRV
ncbi:PIN domain-containing protein [Streptomyces sp. V3I7]|uniref:PIN domain-containing protein n=1 Tax=Streptomyces sp. V3I7 TaxID=3042278 RepID=UPI00277D1D0E|nr:PIN domain-containing protein [Streptomyces sp. V3I7]MDQ0992657.1 putative nucleic acid-binding protein [Streptomyces sp. V3I7]